MGGRWILHADMDAFYASVEQREDPSLRGKAVIVGGAGGRGVVTAASYEARVFGVRSAMPSFRAKQLCPQAVFLPGRMGLYSEISAEIRDIFFNFTPLVEPLALDEAFLDISGSLHFYADLFALGRALKRQIKEKTQLDVSVGIGPNKLVAKLACTLGKPDGLKVVLPEDVSAFLAPLPIRRLWGVGPVTARKLEDANILTIGDAASSELPRLRYLLGDRAATFQARARGIDLSPVESSAPAKSCGEENTFERDILDRERVSAAVTAHAEEVGRRLRAAGLRGRTVTLKVKLGAARGTRSSRLPSENDEPQYPLLSRSQTLAVATDDGALIRQIALSLWDKAAIREPVRLLGVSLSNLEPIGAAAEQLDLFGERQKSDRLGPTLDKIQERFGKGAIRRAVEAPKKISPSLNKRR